MFKQSLHEFFHPRSAHEVHVAVYDDLDLIVPAERAPLTPPLLAVDDELLVPQRGVPREQQELGADGLRMSGHEPAGVGERLEDGEAA